MNVLGFLEIPNLILIPLIVVILIYTYTKWKFSYWRKQGVNGPSPWPFFGNATMFFTKKEFHVIEQNNYKKYGRTFGLYEPTKNMLIVAEPEDLKTILVKDFDKFSERRTFSTRDSITRNMLSVVQGEKWRALRNAVSPSFSGAKMKHMSELVRECSEELAQNLKEYSERNEEFDAKRIFGAYTMDVIANTAFGTKINSQKHPDNEFVANAKKVFSPRVTWRFIIFLVSPKLAERLGISIFEPNVLKFFEKLVRKIIKMRKNETEVRHDFLSVLKDSMNETAFESDVPVKQDLDEEFKKESKKFMDEDMILAQCILFFLAGYDTTATAITMTAYSLALNPDCQEKLIEEVDRILETHDTINYDTIQEMPYLKAVVNETIRLYSPAVRLEREAQENYQLGDIYLEKGTMVGIPVYAIHRDPEFWPEPEKFKPERFIGDHGDRDPYTYIPFGMGQRNCVAKRFALMEVRIAITSILKTMKFVKTSKTCIPPTFTFGIGLLQPTNIFLGVELRSIVEKLKHCKFSISTDGSNDYEDIKLYPIVARFFDEDFGKVVSVLLSVSECSESSTGENIFKLIQNEIKSCGIPWDNLVCFGTDNAAVMIGKFKGVASFLKTVIPSIYVQGCVCHLLHLAASKASSKLEYKVDELLIDIYYYLEKSAKRKQGFLKFQKQHGLPKHKILKHVSTRWLSFGHCVARLINQYPALLSFFESEANANNKSTNSVPRKRLQTCQGGPADKKRRTSAQFNLKDYIQSQKKKTETVKNSKTCNSSTEDVRKSNKVPPNGHCSTTHPTVHKCDNRIGTSDAVTVYKNAGNKVGNIFQMLSDPNTLLYCHFLNSTIPTFDHLNILLQKDEPCIHIMHKVLGDLFADLLIRFIKPKFIKTSKVLDIDFENNAHQKADDDLYIGAAAKQYLELHGECDRTQFFVCVRWYYAAALKYMKDKFDEVLVNATFLDISKRESAKFKQVLYFTKQFNVYECICIHYEDLSVLEKLEEQFIKYQVDPLTSDILNFQRIDTAWADIMLLKHNYSGAVKYDLSGSVAKCVLAFFHSNAECERIFSVINKNKTEFRSTLSTKTLSSLLTRKMSQEYYHTEYSDSLLKKM